MPRKPQKRRSQRAPRPRGTGSIQVKTLADGTEVFYAVIRAHGKLRWHRAGSTPHAAQAKLNELLAAKERGDLPGTSQSHRFRGFALAWLEDFEREDKKPSTVYDYERIVSRVLIPDLGDKLIKDISRTDVAAMVDRRIAGAAAGNAPARRPVSAKTALNEVAVLRKMLRDAALFHGATIQTPAPWQGIKRKHTAREPVWLKPNDVARLISHAPQEHRLLLTVLSSLGLRLGEALALEWSDFNERERTLTIRRSWRQGQLTAPKTDMGKRTLRLGDKLFEAIVARRPRQQKRNSNPASLIYRHAGRPEERPNPHNLIFRSSTNGYIDPSHWRVTVFHPAVKAAGLLQAEGTDRERAPVPHDLRHSAAKRMVELGWPVAKIQATLGHAQVTTTLDLYGQIGAEHHPGPADTLDAA